MPEPSGGTRSAGSSPEGVEQDLLSFLAGLAAALGAIGETVGAVEMRLRVVARAYGLHDAQFTVLPTSVLLTLGRGRAATLETTTRLAATPRLDQIAAVHRLAAEAERGLVAPAEGTVQLEGIRLLVPRYGAVPGVLGYAVLTIGIALVLHPAARDVLAAGVLGILVGLLRQVAVGRRSVETLMPFVAAFTVAAVTALLVEYDVTDPGLRAMIASLVVFIPGVALTTAFLELTEGAMIAGSSRLVWGVAQLGLLAFGIVAGIGAVGVPPEKAFSSSDALLGWWAPWLGVLVFAAGVMIVHSAPPGMFVSLLVVLGAAWTGQVVGSWLFGGWVSGFVGAVVMTLVAYLVARLPSAMPVYATFLPGFWLLVPGSLGLIGLTTIVAGAETAASGDILAIVGSIAAVALGVLVGVELFASLASAEERVRRVGRKRS